MDNAIKVTVEVDPTKPMPAVYRQVSEDDYVREPMTFQEAVVDAAAHQLLAGMKGDDLRRLVQERFEDAVVSAIDERVPAMVEEALTEDVTVTDEWGTSKGSKSVRQLMTERVEQQLKVSRPNSYNRTVLDEAVHKYIDHSLQTELAGAVESAKADLVKRLNEKASEVLARTIERAVVDRVR